MVRSVDHTFNTVIIRPCHLDRAVGIFYILVPGLNTCCYPLTLGPRLLVSTRARYLNGAREFFPEPSSDGTIEVSIVPVLKV